MEKTTTQPIGAYIALSTPRLTFPRAAGTFSVYYDRYDCADDLSAECPVDWLTAEIDAKESLIKVSAAENASGRLRRAVIKLSATNNLEPGDTVSAAITVWQGSGRFCYHVRNHTAPVLIFT